MKIIRHIFINADHKDVKELESAGLNAKEGYCKYNIEENSKEYQLIKNYLSFRKAVDIPYSEFTKEEIINSEFAVIFSNWENGYPQPEEKYIENTFDVTNYDEDCGIGLLQKDFFRIIKEPKWTNKKMCFQLGWIHDEVFVNKDIFIKTFAKFNIKYKDVYDRKGEKIIENVVQLDIPITEINLEIDDNISFSCPTCNRIKYNPNPKGFFPNLSRKEVMPIFKTKEFFGSGGSAHRRIIVSSELKNALLKLNINLSYHPLKSI